MATEEPADAVAFRNGAFEIRDYPALIAAEVTVTGTRNEASNAGFRLLAGYIFGGNSRRQSIATTAPVVRERKADETIAMTAPVTPFGSIRAWVVGFFMPAAFTMDSLPQPNDKRVSFVPVPAERHAVVRFSGLARAAGVERRTADLRAILEREGLHGVGRALLARYNPPWTPWFMRRNKVWIPVDRVSPPADSTRRPARIGQLA